MNGTVEHVQSTRIDKAQRWSVTASLGSIVSAFVASICCVGPLIFALLGLGGAGLLVKLEPYRPYFMVVTFALLGAGFFFTYRKPRTESPAGGGPECECPAPRARRAGKIMLWFATVVVAAFLAFPYVASALFG